MEDLRVRRSAGPNSKAQIRPELLQAVYALGKELGAFPLGYVAMPRHALSPATAVHSRCAILLPRAEGAKFGECGASQGPGGTWDFLLLGHLQ